MLRSVRTERDCKACRRGKLLFSLNCSDCPSYFGGVETRIVVEFSHVPIGVLHLRYPKVILLHLGIC